jgi:cell division protein FtsB
VGLEFDFGNAGRQRKKESLASDRLQKAIDRNRAKQAKRSSRHNIPEDELDLSAASSRGRGRLPGSRLPGSRPQFSEERPEAQARQRTGIRGRNSTPRQAMGGRSSTPKQAAGRSSEKTNLQRRAGITNERPTRNISRTTSGRTVGRSSANTNSRAGITTGRKAVATGDNVEFSTSVKRSVRKAPAKASYSALKTKSRPLKKINSKTKSPDKKTLYTVRFLWVFLGFLTLRLIFSGGGVIDYYTNRSLLLSKVQEYESTKVNSENLVQEIKRIKIDSRYQKKLVRDHLGFIAADEYVILFPKEKS